MDGREPSRNVTMRPEQIEAIARVCHGANRAYCEILGDFTQEPWEMAPAWQRQSACAGVAFHLKNPQATGRASHENWLRDKAAAGWRWGPTKNEETREHPCMVPYDELPLDQRRKDALFIAVVRALTSVC